MNSFVYCTIYTVHYTSFITLYFRRDVTFTVQPSASLIKELITQDAKYLLKYVKLLKTKIKFIQQKCTDLIS